MFLCDSTDARRSGLALSGYWDGRVGAEAAGAGFLRLSQQMSAALEGKEVRTVSNRRVAAIHLLQALRNGPRWTWDVLGQGGRLPCEERKLLLHVLGPALFLQSDLQLNYISMEDSSLLGDLSGVGRWCIYSTMPVKMFPPAHESGKKCASSTFTLQHVPDLESVKTSSGNQKIKVGWPCYAFSHNCAFQFGLNGVTEGVGMKVSSVFQSPAL